ncbi:MAG: transposase [Candidatus Pacebacteria bacterium]|nr:transposase [Candidatus Paceibacterota bacterium]MBP9843057.1 transposase [Candidatus Paceibacterota bacterium]
MRFIGIQHRVKTTASGEGHPTRVAVLDGNKTATSELKDEQAELDFINSLQAGDVVGMILGGSGDYLAYAAHAKAKEVGAAVYRLPTYALKERRGEVEGVSVSKHKDGDHVLLAELVKSEPHIFYPLAETDASLIMVRVAWRNLWEAMQARMAAEQRFRQNFIGRSFTAPGGLYPQGGLEQAFKEAKANDKILSALYVEEAELEKNLKKLLLKTAVYTELFESLSGVGPKIAGRIISAVIDVRRFATAPKLKKFMGVHVLEDGSFARRRHGQVANWHGDARQALFLLGDQFNRRPDSEWGQYLRRMKANLRQKHPEPEMVNRGTEDKPRMVKCYTDGHIHKMATWRTLTRFVEWLHTEWMRLEGPAHELPKKLAA